MPNQQEYFSNFKKEVMNVLKQETTQVADARNFNLSWKFIGTNNKVFNKSKISFEMIVQETRLAISICDCRKTVVVIKHYLEENYNTCLCFTWSKTSEKYLISVKNRLVCHSVINTILRNNPKYRGVATAV